MPESDVRHRHVKQWKWAVFAVMANTAVATAGNVGLMASAFKLAVESGRLAYLAGMGRVLEHKAEASSPLTGFLRIDKL